MRACVLAILWGAALALPGPAAAQDKGAQEKSAIEALNARFAAAFRAGDAKALAGFYTPDAALMPAGAPIARGRAAIEAFWAATIAQIGEVSLTTDEVRPLGEAAVTEIGRFALKTKAQPPAELTGKYAVVWRRTPAGWKLDTDIWNADR